MSSSLPPADVLFLSTEPDGRREAPGRGGGAASVAALAGGAERRPPPAAAGSFAEARAQLERILQPMLQAAKPLPLLPAAAAAPAAAARRSVGAHAAIVAHRCAPLARALLDARARPGEPVPVAEAATCTWRADESRWHVVFGGAAPPSRIVVAALVAHLYGDVLLPALPAHRLPALAQLASALALPRLAALCGDAQVHARRAATGSLDGGLQAAAAGPRAAGDASLAALPEPSSFARDLAAACPRAGAPPPAFADVIVHTRSGSEVAAFPAHRAVLCRVAYFRAQLYGFTAAAGAAAPAVAAIILEDAEPAVFARLLEALYSGDLAQCMQSDSLLGTLALASRLCMTDVVQRLQDAVCDAAQPADAAVLADFAEVHSLPQLTRMAAGLAATAAAVAAADD